MALIMFFRNYQKSTVVFTTAFLTLFVLRSTAVTYFQTEGIELCQIEYADPSESPSAPSGVVITDELVESLPKIPSNISANSETYGNYAENPRIDVLSNPVSTFSIDVDTASYTNTRRFLKMGNLPPKDSVRIEEFVNYFDYKYVSLEDKPFGVNFEVGPSPFDSKRYLLKVGLKARESKKNSDLGWNLVFLVDVSGSMSDQDKLPLVKQGMKLLTNNMRPKDKVSIVTYAGTAGVVLETTSGDKKAKILNAIDSLGAGGSTNGSGGIELAYRIAHENYIKGSVNRVILAADGDFNVGTVSFDGLMDLIEQERKKGVTLTTVGFGQGNINDRNMEQLADRGNGNYFYADSFRELRRIFGDKLASNMEIVAKDVKLQLEFNPAVVTQYRLIGFDNRQLKKEDFTNDQKDAGEIGSGHTVTALYEIALTDSQLGQEIRESLRYGSKKPVVLSEEADKLKSEIGFLKIRAKEPEGEVSREERFPIQASLKKDSIDETSNDFRFASSVAYFGQMLRKSDYAGNVTFDEILKVAKKSVGDDKTGNRQEFIELVQDAKVIK